MKTDYLLLVVALIALWVPTAALLPFRMREKVRQAVRRQDDGILSLLRNPFNWIDLFRGAGGAWLVKEAVFHFSAGQDDLALVFRCAQFLIFFIAVVAQTLWLGSPVRFIGPLFFLGGLTVVVSEGLVGGFSLALGLTCALMLSRLSLVFVFAPILLAVFGRVFGKLGLELAYNAMLFALPILLAFIFGLRLSFIRSPRDSSLHRRPIAGSAVDAKP